jgi:hypothetical protein
MVAAVNQTWTCPSCFGLNEARAHANCRHCGGPHPTGIGRDELLRIVAKLSHECVALTEQVTSLQVTCTAQLEELRVLRTK